MTQARTARLDDLAKPLGGGPRWAMVRSTFGIGAFGINAYVADEADVEIIGEHDELGERSGKHEELYVVARGHARFTINGEDVDAPAGTFVFVRDPAARRKAVAVEPDTAIVIAGGRAGEAFSPSPWERMGPVLEHFGEGEYERAREALLNLLAETPDDPGVLYNLACAESRLGNRDEALTYLERAAALGPEFRGAAANDPDLEAISDDPRFASALAGQANTGGSRS